MWSSLQSSLRLQEYVCSMLWYVYGSGELLSDLRQGYLPREGAEMIVITVQIPVCLEGKLCIFTKPPNEDTITVSFCSSL